MNVPQLILTGITKFATVDEVNRWLAPLVGKRLVKANSPLVEVDDLRLTEASRKMIGAHGKPMRMDELMAASGGQHEEYSRLLYALSLLGIVIPEERQKAAPVKPAPEPAAAPKEKPAEKPAAPQTDKTENVEKIKEEVH